MINYVAELNRRRQVDVFQDPIPCASDILKRRLIDNEHYTFPFYESLIGNELNCVGGFLKDVRDSF